MIGVKKNYQIDPFLKICCVMCAFLGCTDKSFFRTIEIGSSCLKIGFR